MNCIEEIKERIEELDDLIYNVAHFDLKGANLDDLYELQSYAKDIIKTINEIDNVEGVEDIISSI